MENKKGVSGIIATVLLIMIVVVAAVIIAGVIIPFVQDNVGDTTEVDCIKDRSKIEIINSKTCKTVENNINLVIGRGNVNLADIYIIFESDGGDAIRKTIKQDFNLELPDKGGGQKLYSFDASDISASSEEFTLDDFNVVRIGIMVSDDESCDFSEEIELQEC